MIFSEELRLAIWARTRGIEHVLMWRLGSTQSEYDGPNQSNICSVENSVLSYRSKSVKRGKERTEPMANESCQIR